MTTVFLLQHEHEIDGHDESKLLGVFSNRSLAEQAKVHYETQPGFRDHLDGFTIDEYTLDESHWLEGFVTV